MVHIDVCLAQTEYLLVSFEQLLAELEHLVTRHCDLFLHVCDEQVLVELVDVGASLHVAQVHRFFIIERIVLFLALCSISLLRPYRIIRHLSVLLLGGGVCRKLFVSSEGTTLGGPLSETLRDYFVLIVLEKCPQVLSQLLDLLLLEHYFFLKFTISVIVLGIRAHFKIAFMHG